MNSHENYLEIPIKGRNYKDYHGLWGWGANKHPPYTFLMLTEVVFLIPLPHGILACPPNKCVARDY